MAPYIDSVEPVNDELSDEQYFAVVAKAVQFTQDAVAFALRALCTRYTTKDFAFLLHMHACKNKGSKRHIKMCMCACYQVCVCVFDFPSICWPATSRGFISRGPHVICAS